ncbi:hypothetical protein GOP47_0018197 [Adiantum capillus-veneris]|uniref:Glycosyltransferase N-terminal domain-containing protein n=1 Tax=Adiantum capillus-veneris TaxID=13818 RepID=A0A9D4UGV3_ADICA|nr:hypothetical protein GOP47_0018197 [Adiantum capillus-veneris]
MGREIRAHIVVLPFAQQGHINPLMQLSRKLASRGAEVTFVVSENTASKAAAGALPNLKVVGVPDNLPPERSKGSSFRDSVDSMINMEASFADLLGRLHDQVSALVYDAFMTWAPAIAHSLSIPCFCFFTTNAIAGAVCYHVPSLIRAGILPFRKDGDNDSPLPQDSVKGIAGAPDLLPEEFPLCLTFDATHFRFRFVANIAEKFHEASAIIINTFEELESDAIAALKVHKPLFAVGPLLLLSGRPSRLDVNYWPEEDHCLHWLDSQAPSSVLYVSFGSVASLPLLHFQELALGLEASEQPFLWVVRQDSVDAPLIESAFPNGFRERTKDRGLIITWGPQLLILAHPSIGGFFTHGGWNSIIENMSLGSVPMICWPHVAEQRLNRRMMVKHWNIGMGLRHRADGSVAKEEIARVVGDLFHGKQGMDLRNASKEVGDMAKAAVAEKGSSQKNFEALYNLLSS